MRFTFHSLDQMSRLLKCGRQQVRNMVARGDLEAATWGRHILIIVRHDDEGDETNMEIAA